MWRLRGGKLATVSEGCFLEEGQDISMGSAGLAFVNRAVPLFDVPWWAKLALEAAGVAVKDVTPANLRFGFPRYDFFV